MYFRLFPIPFFGSIPKGMGVCVLGGGGWGGAVVVSSRCTNFTTIVFLNTLLSVIISRYGDKTKLLID